MPDSRPVTTVCGLVDFRARQPPAAAPSRQPQKPLDMENIKRIAKPRKVLNSEEIVEMWRVGEMWESCNQLQKESKAKNVCMFYRLRGSALRVPPAETRLTVYRRF